MTAAANRRKGYNYARTITAWLRDHGWPHATQRSAGQSGSDILEMPLLTVEVKSVQKTALGEWCTQAARDAELEDADVWVVIHKRRGVTDPAQQFATTTLEQFNFLLIEAGYGDPIGLPRHYPPHADTLD